MENRFKNRISRMFWGSLGSCRARNLSDVIEKSVFVPYKDYHLISTDTDDLQHPKSPLPFPSICRPKCPDSSCSQFINPVQKKSDRNRYRYPTGLSANNARYTCPPASPAFPFVIPYHMEHDYYGSLKERKSTLSPVESKKDKKNKTLVRSNKKKKKKNSNNKKDKSLSSSSSLDSNAYYNGGYIDSYNWFSITEEEEEREREDEPDTLFSSRSTTLSSESTGTSKRHHTHRRAPRNKKKSTSSSGRSSHVLPLKEGGKVTDSFAVVKSSSDPYNDFRTSMVEMIVEKQIFATKDLEQLLQCFLSLNSKHHHRVIVEVFTEIWEALFSNWS